MVVGEVVEERQRVKDEEEYESSNKQTCSSVHGFFFSFSLLSLSFLSPV